jgi:hypothetical protein
MAKHQGRNRVCSAEGLDSQRSMEALIEKLIGWLDVSTIRPGPQLLADL